MKISVFGLFRDSESTIHESLKRLDDLHEIDDCDFEFFFYENDSVDNTRSILNEWVKERDAIFFYEDINAPKYGSVTNEERLMLLSYYRNKLKSMAGNLTSDFSLLLDTDIVFSNKHVSILLDELRWNPNRVMVTANTRQVEIPDVLFGETSDSYYDVFACRDYYNNDCFYFANCPLILEDDRNKWNNNIPVTVSSAFGGLAVVSNLAFNYSKWSTNGHSEHVNFCKEVSRFGEICIVPSCTPRAVIDINTVSKEIISRAQVIQKKRLAYCNSLFKNSVSFIMELEQNKKDSKNE